MVIHYTNIYNNVVFPGKKACIFRFKGRKSCANGDSVTLEFMLRLRFPLMAIALTSTTHVEINVLNSN